MKLNGYVKTTFIMVLAAFLLAMSGDFASGRSLRVAWENGVVTKAPWSDPDGSRHIEVNDHTYTFVSPDVRLERHMRTPSDAWSVEAITLSEIRVGQDILIRVAAHHIYYLIIQMN
jgi:hypothetical protein